MRPILITVFISSTFRISRYLQRFFSQLVTVTRFGGRWQCVQSELSESSLVSGLSASLSIGGEGSSRFTFVVEELLPPWDSFTFQKHGHPDASCLMTSNMPVARWVWNLLSNRSVPCMVWALTLLSVNGTKAKLLHPNRHRPPKFLVS